MKQLISVLILALVLAACGTAPSPPIAEEPMPDNHPSPPETTAPAEADAGVQLVEADIPRIANPQVGDEQVAELVTGNNAFAFDLYRALAAQGQDNLIYSPYSISLAFSMVYAGARGETQAQMAEVFNYLPQETHHPAFNLLDQRLSNLGRQAEGQTDAGDPFQLDIANAVWGQQGLPFEQAFLQILAQQYGAGLRAVDFGQMPDAAREQINAWVADQTQERIKDIMPPGSVTPDTRMVLANAIYFKASWLSAFDESATQDGAFTLLDGSEETVPLMRQTMRFAYAEGDGYQAVQLPYIGSVASMLIVLPAAGRFEEVERRLSAELLEQIRAVASPHDVVLTLPRFEFEASFSLPEMLSDMGAPALFDAGQADLSGIAEGQGLFVSDARHKAFVKVDEQGTEAAAATAVAIAETAFQLVEMTADRPFIFAIVEEETGSILFLGRVTNPASS